MLFIRTLSKLNSVELGFNRENVLLFSLNARPAGYKDAPKTWQELGEMALKAQKPPETYGMGFALSNVGDGNLTTSMLQSWGGRIADDAGKTCTIDSQPTRDFPAAFCA
jgi:ABC-type glycerol-3-phosphate transport system substrate-binding protein